MRKYNFSGFTLFELMAAIAVAAILLAVGVPSFFEIIRNNRIVTQTNEVVSALNFARAESVKRGIPVSVCASDDGGSCSGSTTWTGGWIVFTDGTGTNGTVDNGANGDEVLQVWPGITGGIGLDSTRTFIQYTSTGMPNPVGSTTFDLLKPGYEGDKARCISIATTGRVSTTKGVCP